MQQETCVHTGETRTVNFVFALAASLLCTGCGSSPDVLAPDTASVTSTQQQTSEASRSMTPAIEPALPTKTVSSATVSSATVSSAQTNCPIQLQDVSQETGITFTHTDGSSGRRFIVESVSTGLASFDYDGDGRIDLYFPNGAPLPGTEVEQTPRHALYRNLGDWQFRDVTEAAGVGCTGYGLGATVGDYDQDGHPDLYVSNFGPKVLYRNNGDGTFSDVTADTDVADGNKVGAGVAFLDIEGDGDLDLYVSNYVRFTFENHESPMIRGVPQYHGPRDYQAWPDTLYRNNGNGTFTDVSAESGISAVVGTGMGMVCLDFDADRDTDIFVLNDVAGNFLFQNNGSGEFEEVGLSAGVAYDIYGVPNGSMGADCGDVDNDGWLDLYVTTYQSEKPALYTNLGNGAFEDTTPRTGAGEGTRPFVTWGTGIVDFDNDGLRDLFIACGHINDNVELFDDTTAYKNHNILLRNVGGRFVNVSALCGLETLPKRSARGVVFDDLDNDGDIDTVVLNSREPLTVLRNLYVERGGTNHWLQVRLQGVNSNRGGVGAHVKVTAGNLVLTDEVHSGRSYQSHFGSRLHFGLGDRDHVDRIEIRWIGGGIDVFEHVDVDQLITLTEGHGREPESKTNVTIIPNHPAVKRTRS